MTEIEIKALKMIDVWGNKEKAIKELDSRISSRYLDLGNLPRDIAGEAVNIVKEALFADIENLKRLRRAIAGEALIIDLLYPGLKNIMDSYSTDTKPEA